MKKLLFASILMFSIMMWFAVASANAQQSNCSGAQIPFAFAVAGRTLPEGAYTICQSYGPAGAWIVTELTSL